VRVIARKNGERVRRSLRTTRARINGSRIELALRELEAKKAKTTR
jgi:hypothetical protein